MATNPFEQPPLGRIATTDYMICGIRRFVRTFRYMLQDRIEDKLPKVNVPALVVRGSHDQIVSQRWSEEATRLLRTARLVVIPGAGHAINFSYPAAFREAILPFLRGETGTIQGGEGSVSDQAKSPFARLMTPARGLA